MLIQSEEDFENVTDEEWDYIGKQVSNVFAHTIKYVFDEDMGYILWSIVKSYFVDTLVMKEGVNDLKAKVGRKVIDHSTNYIDNFVQRFNEIDDMDELTKYLAGFDQTNQMEAHYEALMKADYDHLVENSNMDSYEE